MLIGWSLTYQAELMISPMFSAQEYFSTQKLALSCNVPTNHSF